MTDYRPPGPEPDADSIGCMVFGVVVFLILYALILWLPQAPQTPPEPPKTYTGRVVKDIDRDKQNVIIRFEDGSSIRVHGHGRNVYFED